jgi:hypothetical protein
MFARPTYYFAALGITEDATKDEVTKAYRALAANGEHPDHGGDCERWQLITAAFNELKAMFSKKRGRYENKSDEAWKRAWDALVKPAATKTPKAEQPKAEKTSYAATHPTGTKSDRSKRCGRQTASGPCCRPANHPHGCMSQAVKERKAAAEKAKKEAKRQANADTAAKAASAAA